MTITKKIEIYINLLEEGIRVLRPAFAEVIDDNTCRVLPIPDYDPKNEIWEFLPGTIVNYKPLLTDDGSHILIAVAQNRIELLNNFIKYQDVSEQILKLISSHPWDYTGKPAVVSSEDIKRVLILYIEQKITSTDIEKWADTLECRDDVEVNANAKQILFELANPSLGYPIALDRIKKLIEEL